MTQPEAIALYESGFWKDLTDREIAEFQLLEDRLCMPIPVFQSALQKTIGRPVFTHEFGLNRQGLIEEVFGDRPTRSKTLAEIIEMIPAEQRLYVLTEKVLPPRIPTFPIKRRWFDMIASGKKREEYRSISSYYDRFIGRRRPGERFTVRFRNGYRPDSPLIECLVDYRIGEGREEWGAVRFVSYYVLSIHSVSVVRPANGGTETPSNRGIQKPESVLEP